MNTEYKIMPAPSQTSYACKLKTLTPPFPQLYFFSERIIMWQMGRAFFLPVWFMIPSKPDICKGSTKSAGAFFEFVIISLRMSHPPKNYQAC